MLGLLKRDKDASVRSRAAQALGHASGEKVVAALVAALKDEDAFVGAYAAHTLGRLGGPEVIPALEQYIQGAPKDGQKDAAKKAIEAIRARSKSAPPTTVRYKRLLKGERLAHYLAAEGPKLPRPEQKDDGLQWGPSRGAARVARRSGNRAGDWTNSKAVMPEKAAEPDLTEYYCSSTDTR